MGLSGLREFLEEGYNASIFSSVAESKKPWEFQLHGERIVKAVILENHTYEIKLDIEGAGAEDIHKTSVKFLYPAEQAESVRKLIKTDKKVKQLKLEPIIPAADRYYVKNKSLFPLMKEKRVLFFTLLEGDIIRGIVAGFSRYDLTVHQKGGLPVTILRHSIYDVRDKNERCFLKSFQEKQRDWQKSDLFVPETGATKT